MGQRARPSVRRIQVATPIFAAIGIAIVATSSISAWGLQGHRLVARVAETRLTAVAKQNVTWLLDGRSAADVSSWADDYLGGNYQTSFWHYVNIPPDAAAYDRDRDCPRQPNVAAGARNDRWRDCIVDRIPYNLERLGNASLDRADRAIALKFLVHFVGDLHQPFHALGVERGGNGILVTVFGSPTCGARRRRRRRAICTACGIPRSSPIGSFRMRSTSHSSNRSSWPNSSPPGQPERRADWAMESVALSKAALLPQQGIVDEKYFQAQIAVVDERLALAGLRLAALVNATLTAPPPPK